MAGGTGSRLRPLTISVNKHLLPVYDKPLIYYPLATLLIAGIKEIAIVSTEDALPNFKKLLGTGERFGVTFTYILQENAIGIADGIKKADEFLGNDSLCLILGDNILIGGGLGTQLSGYQNLRGAQIFGYRVENPNEYGVAKLDSGGNILELVEKPKENISDIAIPGLYFYDSEVSHLVNEIKPSTRGELEITDLNRLYLERGELSIDLLNRGTVWLDSGTQTSLHDAGSYVRIVQERQGLRMSQPEEIAVRNGWVSSDDAIAYAIESKDADLSAYLIRIKQNEEF